MPAAAVVASGSDEHVQAVAPVAPDVLAGNELDVERIDTGRSDAACVREHSVPVVLVDPFEQVFSVGGFDCAGR